MIRFMQRHPTLWGLIVRGPIHAWVSRRIWRLLDTPEFRADMKASMADFAAGRKYQIVDHDLIPSDTWSPDDPQQPEGWRHDGAGWVRA